MSLQGAPQTHGPLKNSNRCQTADRVYLKDDGIETLISREYYLKSFPRASPV
jgi:hypothetical protein